MSLPAWLVLDNGNWKCLEESHELSRTLSDPPETTWCEHIREMIDRGDDAEMYHLGLKLSVPIFPTNDIWVMVVIDSTPVVARSALMSMEYTPDIGNTKVIQLGLWNPGEGAGSMRTCVVDYIKSRLDPGEYLTRGSFKTRCPNPSHSIRASRIMEEKCDTPGWKWQCLWNMVMEGACTVCLGFATGDDPDDNFGLDDSLIAKPRWSS